MPEFLQAVKREMEQRSDYFTYATVPPLSSSVPPFSSTAPPLSSSVPPLSSTVPPLSSTVPPLSTSPSTLYIGGGTPSLYKPEELGELIVEAKRLWKCEFQEITIEMNPEDVTPDYCARLTLYGVNRLSFGIQSFFDAHLHFMNRRHNAMQGIRAFEAARSAGFQNISIDLIFGFPGLSLSQWKSNIEQAIALHPEHISAYQLGIEPGTPLYRRVQKGLLQPVPQEEAADQYAILQEMLPLAGWAHYEISNFAREGYRSRHNSAYWQGAPYLGLGPSAHSYNGVKRYFNVRNLGRYLDGFSYVKTEQLLPRMRYNEFIMTRLRTSDGFSERELTSWMAPWCRSSFIEAMERHFHAATAPLLEKGLLILHNEMYMIPPEKWFISDGIIVSLIM